MMSNQKKLVWLVVLALLSSAAVPAMADLYGTVDVTYQDYSPQTNVVIYTYTAPINTVAGTAQLDLANVTGVPVSWEPFLTGSIEAFCIDVADTTSNVGDTINYDVVSLESAPDAWAGPMGETRARYLAELLDENWTDNMSAVQAAALQLAVWEVVDESRVTTDDPKTAATGLDIDDGKFYAEATSDILTAAQLMLDNIDGGANYSGKYAALTNDEIQQSKDFGGQYQDWVVRVPVPAAVWLGMLGLSAAGLKLRRKSA